MSLYLSIGARVGSAAELEGGTVNSFFHNGVQASARNRYELSLMARRYCTVNLLFLHAIRHLQARSSVQVRSWSVCAKQIQNMQNCSCVSLQFTTIGCAPFSAVSPVKLRQFG